jgi:MFS family permease
MAALTLGHRHDRLIISLAVLQGVIITFDMPAQHHSSFRWSNRNDLSNAIAINSSMMNAARLIGPAVAGVLISIIGEGGCFHRRYQLAVIVSLLMMRVRPREARARQPDDCEG